MGEATESKILPKLIEGHKLCLQIFLCPFSSHDFQFLLIRAVSFIRYRYFNTLSLLIGFIKYNQRKKGGSNCKEIAPTINMDSKNFQT